MSNIHANQPHIHLQQHSIKHSSHNYAVETSQLPVFKKHLRVYSGHKLLWSLLSVFAVLVLVLIGIQYLPSTISSFGQMESENRSSQASATAAAQAYRNMLLYSTPAGLQAYNPATKEVISVSDQTLTSLIQPTTRISRSQSGDYALLYSPITTSATILNFVKENSTPFTKQLIERFQQPQILDVMWHPNQPIMYLLISAVDINFRRYFLVSYELSNNQLQFSNISPAANPTLAWVNSSNQKVYIHSLLPTGLSQLDEVLSHTAPKTTLPPLRLHGKANEVGHIVASNQNQIGLTTIFNPTERFIPLPFDIDNSSIRHAIWRPGGSGVTLTIDSTQTSTITSFSASALINCSHSLERFDSEQSIFGLQYLVSQGKEALITDLQTCASEALPAQTSTTTTKLHGWL